MTRPTYPGPTPGDPRVPTGGYPGHPPTWPIPPQGGHPGPGLHPAGFGGPYQHPPPRRGPSGPVVVAVVLGLLALAGLVVGAIVVTSRAAPATDPPAAAPVAPAAPTATRPAAGVPTRSTDLALGDCLATIPDGATVTDVSVVPCTAAHEGEVFHVFDLTDATFPGQAEIRREAGETCNARYRTAAPAAFADDAYGLFAIYPTQSTWPTGDRAVVCIASTETATTGSVLGR